MRGFIQGPPLCRMTVDHRLSRLRVPRDPLLALHVDNGYRRSALSAIKCHPHESRKREKCKLP